MSSVNPLSPNYFNNAQFQRAQSPTNLQATTQKRKLDFSESDSSGTPPERPNKREALQQRTITAVVKPFPSLGEFGTTQSNKPLATTKPPIDPLFDLDVSQLNVDSSHMITPNKVEAFDKDQASLDILYYKNQLLDNQKKSNGDRYISYRPNSKIRQERYHANSMELSSRLRCDRDKGYIKDWDRESYRELLTGTLFETSMKNFRKQPILALTHSSHTHKQGKFDKTIFDIPGVLLESAVSKRFQINQVVPIHASTVLDAPHLIDDYYASPIGCSKTNNLAISLPAGLYIYNLDNKTVEGRSSPQLPMDQYKSIAWTADSESLLISTLSQGVFRMNISDPNSLRSLGNFADYGEVRVLVPYNDNTVYLGSKDGQVIVRDLRAKLPIQGGCNLSQFGAVCAIAPSSNDNTIAIGSDKNMVQIRDRRYLYKDPICELKQHQAAVKALVWDPYNYLLTGAGLADRHIRIFDVARNSIIDEVDTGSQVCSIQYPEHANGVFASTHGDGTPDNMITIWKYNNVTKRTVHLGDIPRQKNRILYSAMNNDQTTLIAASPDQTVRIWENIFPKENKVQSKTTSSLMFNHKIR